MVENKAKIQTQQENYLAKYWPKLLLIGLISIIHLIQQMRTLKIPTLTRNILDATVTLTYKQPKYSLLWMHGLGDHPDSYIPFFTHHLSPLYSGCRIKLLHAPSKLLAQTQTNTSAWYDPTISSASSGQKRYEIEMNQVNGSHKFIQQHFDEQVQLWKQDKQSKIAPQHRVYVGGMGQGATIALHYAFTNQLIPAGVIALSGVLLKETQLVNKGRIPALIMHGQKDRIIREIQARQSYSELLKDQYLVEYNTFNDLEHGVNLQQLTKISQWIDESHTFIKKHYETTK